MRAIVPRDVGNYSYAGMGYANPHAVTSVGGTTYTYDNNGNVTAIGSFDYTWDWRNRLASAERSAGGITTYGYDHTGQRVFQATGSATTSYPNRYYNVASSSLTAKTTKHIFSPDGTLLATVVGASTTASTTYLHSDHLGGTNVTTDSNGAVTQTLDYYPYGSQRIATGSFSEQRKFIGHEYDQENDLTYANARYYEQNVAKWLSQDPASRDNPAQFLTDPQQLNGYSYGRNNPLILVDRGGRKVELATRQLNEYGSPVSSFGHAFLVVTPDNPNTIGSINGIDTSSPFTLGAYANAESMLYKSANAPSDYVALTGECPTCAFVTVSPPAGVSSEEFDRRVVDFVQRHPRCASRIWKNGTSSMDRCGQLEQCGFNLSNSGWYKKICRSIIIKSNSTNKMAR